MNWSQAWRAQYQKNATLRARIVILIEGHVYIHTQKIQSKQSDSCWKYFAHLQNDEDMIKSFRVNKFRRWKAGGHQKWWRSFVKETYKQPSSCEIVQNKKMLFPAAHIHNSNQSLITTASIHLGAFIHSIVVSFIQSAIFLAKLTVWKKALYYVVHSLSSGDVNFMLTELHILTIQSKCKPRGTHAELIKPQHIYEMYNVFCDVWSSAEI